MRQQTANGDGNQSMEIMQPEVTQPTLGQLTAAEVDMQVTTAKRYPRSLQAFKHEVLSLATIDEETARSCTYTIPRGGKHITGPSIRFMEIVASSWGNMREEKRCLEPEGTVIRGQATVWDMERNRLVRAEVTRRITDKNGNRYNEDMITVTGNAAASIAHRNALRACIPEGFWKKIHEQVQEVGAGGKKPLSEKRAQWMEFWKKQGVSAERVLGSLNVPSVEDIGVGELATMQGLYTAIKEGDTTLEVAFPQLQESPVEPLPGAHTFGFGTRKAQAQAQAKAQPQPQPDPQPQEPQGQARVGAQLTEQLAQGVGSMGARQAPQAQPQAEEQAGPSPWVQNVLRLNLREAQDSVDTCTDPMLLIELAKAESRKGVLSHIGKRLQGGAKHREEVAKANTMFPGQAGAPRAPSAPAGTPQTPGVKVINPDGSIAVSEQILTGSGQDDGPEDRESYRPEAFSVAVVLDMVRAAVSLQQLMELERDETRAEVLEAIGKRCQELDDSLQGSQVPQPQQPPAQPQEEAMPWDKYTRRGLAEDKGSR